MPAVLLSQVTEGLTGFTGRKNYSEELYVRTDRDVYIAGEPVLLKVYCLNGVLHTPSHLSRVVYVSLIDSLNNPVVQVKLGLPGSSGSGQLLLPDTLSSGNYCITACTQWMKNFSNDLFSYNSISVINPFRTGDNVRQSSSEAMSGKPDLLTIPEKKGDESEGGQSEAQKIIQGENNSSIGTPMEPPAPFSLSVKTNKSVYRNREKVIIDITATDKEGRPVESDLVISLAKSFSLSGKADPNVRLTSGNAGANIHSGTGQPFFLPEPDGHLVCGIIKNTLSGEPLRNEPIVLSFVGKSALCRFTTTDSAGRFTFVCTEQGTRELVIQPLSGELEEYYAELDNPFPESFTNLEFLPLRLDTSRLEEINNAVISMQIRKIYESLPADTVRNVALPVRDFYGKPDNSVLMSTFIRLTSLQEAIKEIIPGVITTRKRGKTVINSVFRFKDKVTVTNPLILVDGVPVWDHEKVLAIGIDKIEKVDVLNFGYIFAKIYLDGIIDITTVDGNLSEPLFENNVFRQEFEALQQARALNTPDYSISARRESRIPDFRNTLYWNPGVRTDRQGRATVEFYTSDETGTYTVLVEGFALNGAAGKTFSVLKVAGSN